MSGNPDYIFYLEIINYRIHLPYSFLQLLGDRIILSKAINGYTMYPHDIYCRLIDKAETLPCFRKYTSSFKQYPTGLYRAYSRKIWMD